MRIQKYGLQVVRQFGGTNPPRGSYNNELKLIILKREMTKVQAKETIAHELAHFFYQYELDTNPERIERRFNTADMADLGGKISEMIAHIVGHYGAEIQQLTNVIYSHLWKDM